MGVIYKLKPEVINLILDKKKNDPALSCRGVARMLEHELKVKVSKSSINALFKEAALSLPVGRRCKKPRKLKPPAIPLPAIKDIISVEKPPEVQPVMPAEPVVPPEPAAAIELGPPPEPAVPLELAPPAIPEESQEITSPEPPSIILPEAVTPAEPLVEPVPSLTEEPIPESAPQPEEEPIPLPVEEAPTQAVTIPVEKAVEMPVFKPQPPWEPIDNIPFELVGAELESSGVIILRAADCLLGGSALISEIVNKRLYRPKNNLISLTQGAIFHSLFEQNNAQSGISALLQKKLSLDIINSYLAEMQSISLSPSDYSQLISSLFQEVRGIKAVLSDAESLYLDGQLHTVWSTNHLPYDFSIPAAKLKNYISRYFRESQPFVLFMAPGYDIPIKEFFSFVASFTSSEKKIQRLVLYGNKLEELETIHLEQAQNRFLVFGLWPWQFNEYRKVKKLGEFKPRYIDALLRELYLAEIEIEITQPIANKRVILTGYAVKVHLSEKTRLVILSNLPSHLAPAKELADTYFNRWPNLEEGFQEFSRKIELFTYTASSQRSFSTASLGLGQNPIADTKEMFNNYLNLLELYVRYHFLPQGFQEQSFDQTKEHFYNLKVILKKEKTGISAIFKPPTAYPFLKELIYLCRRLNEQEIMLNENNQLWLRV